MLILQKLKHKASLIKKCKKHEGDQAIEQILEQGGVDVAKIEAQGGIDKYMQSEEGKQKMQQLAEQGKIDKKSMLMTTQNLKQGNVDIARKR